MSVMLRVEDDAKSLGAFYTPDSIAGMLAQWVVQTGDELILEPSVGEGALLKAALESGARKRRGKARLRFIACDVNPKATNAICSWLPPPHHVYTTDFLSLDPDKVGLVHGVLANPPFTRNHALAPNLRRELRKRFEVEGAAGLWVHFLFHACEFLCPGGRLAAIVPASAMFTTYGRKALGRICANFAQVELRRIVGKPLWVNGADERGAVILAGGYGLGRCDLPAVSDWSAGGEYESHSFANPSCYVEALAQSKPLGSLATFSIGAVTGRNSVFLLNEDERRAEGIGEGDVVAIAGRVRHVPGLTVDRADLTALAQAGEKTWLLSPSDLNQRRSGVRRRLSLIDAATRRNTVWLTKRSPWWRVDSGPDCDALFTYMNDHGPRLILAGPGVKCTNTLHRVRFLDEIDRQQQMSIALSIVSTFGQFAAEQAGRSYGGGVLKFELRDARALPILSAQARISGRDFMAADAAMRAKDFGRARTIADRLLLPMIFSDSWQTAAREMSSELRRLRAVRHGRVR